MMAMFSDADPDLWIHNPMERYESRSGSSTGTWTVNVKKHAMYGGESNDYRNV